MDEAPPPYDGKSSRDVDGTAHDNVDSKFPSIFSIRDELGTSQNQLVAAMVSKLVPRIRERTRRGLAKSTLALMPSEPGSDQIGVLVGFPEDGIPEVIHLEGRFDTLEFWTQPEILSRCKQQLLAAISPETPVPEPQPITSPAPDPLASRSGWFGRKKSAAPGRATPAPVVVESTSVEVAVDEIHFRRETEYGLYETVRRRALMVVVMLR